MSKSGLVIWRERVVTWRHHGFASSTDLSYKPHFELTVMDGTRDKKRAITFDNIVITDQKLRGVEDLLKLPGEVQELILDNAVDAWEKEYSSARR